MTNRITAPVSGMRDFLPIDALRRRYAVAIVEDVYQSYGFEPLETPVMERLETLLGKYGEEGDQLIFRVMKRGRKLHKSLQEEGGENDLADAGLRYDLTVPLARVAAEYQGRLPRYLKRYQIQQVYRADRPARGRFREFYQCDLDITGSKSLLVETEILSAAASVLARLGFPIGDFQIRLNDRRVLSALLESAGVAPALEESALVAIDKMDKVGRSGVGRELRERGVSERSSETLLRWMDETPQEIEPALEWLLSLLEASPEAVAAVQDLRQIVTLCADGPAHGALKIDPYLARGLGYYTGAIFEVAFTDLPGSAGGGGRYDNLIGMFSGREVPACGFSLGLERILILLEERGLFPQNLAGRPELLVTLFDEAAMKHSLALCRMLRAEGFRVDLYPGNDRYGKQFKYAEQRDIRYALLVGPEELERNVVTVKDLQTGQQLAVESRELAEELRTRLR
jgi:histidyl-tRNA synthetase